MVNGVIHDSLEELIWGCNPNCISLRANRPQAFKIKLGIVEKNFVSIFGDIEGNTICTHRKFTHRKKLISLPNLTGTRTHNFLTS